MRFLVRLSFSGLTKNYISKQYIIARPYFGFSLFKVKKYSTFTTDNSLDDSNSESSQMEANKVVKKLRAYAAPTLAGKWDNVGLLIEPTPPHEVKSMLLTNDLTVPVLEEAISKKVDMVLSYHPPLFEPLKRLTQRSWKEMIAVRCIENRIAVYSPHTSYDAVAGGVNDWLISPFEGKTEVIERVFETNFPMVGGYRLEFTLPQELEEKVQKQMESLLSSIPGVCIVTSNRMENGGTRLCLNCTEKSVSKVVDYVSGFEAVKTSVELFKSEKPPIPKHGYGRTCVLSSPITVQQAVDKVKAHLGLKQVRLALAVNKQIDAKVKKVAVCAGSGASTLNGIESDLYITGEMSHHQVLDANHHGVHVILCDHSNTERGYLKIVKEKLSELLDNKVELIISEVDRDPLEIV